MRFKIFLVILALVIVPPAPSIAKSVQQEFSQAWQDREARYAAEVQKSSAEFEKALKDFVSTPQSEQQALNEKSQHLIAKAEALGFSAGRADVVFRLRKFMATKPSAERAAMWLQDEINQTTIESERAQAALAVARKTEGKDDATAMRGLLSAIISIGGARGTVAELGTTNDNLLAYYQAKGAQDQRRRNAWAAALQGLGQSLQQSSQNNGWTATCRRFGNTTTCSGN